MHTKQKKIRARIGLAVSLLLVTVGHYFFWRFSFDRTNTYPISQALTVGSIIWTTVLFGAMWLRYGWSRYVTITMICFAIIGFCSLALIVRSESIDPLAGLMKLVVIGVVFDALALIPLSASESIRIYLGPRTAGDR
jgi:hypothetical protein